MLSLILLNLGEIRSRASEGFGMIHFFGFDGRHDKLSLTAAVVNFPGLPSLESLTG